MCRGVGCVARYAQGQHVPVIKGGLLKSVRRCVFTRRPIPAMRRKKASAMIKGSRCCGAVGFEWLAAPSLMGNCHCTRCRKRLAIQPRVLGRCALAQRGLGAGVAHLTLKVFEQCAKAFALTGIIPVAV